MARITISLPDDVLEAVDDRKGLASRSAWIAHTLRQATVAVTSSGGTANITAGSPPARFRPSAQKQPKWRCTKCEWVSFGSSSQCPRHGYGDVVEVSA
jgi:hypothetical protein